MSERTQHLRDMLTRHEPWDPYGTGLQLLDELEEQQEQIEALNERLNSINVATGNVYQRHENQVADLRKEIDRLKGVHGA